MPTSRVIIILYAFVATTNIMASVRGPASLDWATTPLLFPLLVGVVLAAAHERQRRVSRTVLVTLTVAGIANIVGEFALSGGLPVWATVAIILGQFALAYGWTARRTPSAA